MKPDVVSTAQQAQDLLDHHLDPWIYKAFPGLHIVASHDGGAWNPGHRLYITVSMPTLDTQCRKKNRVADYDSQVQTLETVGFPVPTELFWSTVSTVLKRLWAHEVDEWLVVDGEFIHNPHPEAPEYTPYEK